MDKFTEPTTIIDSHYGRYITAYALEWCIKQGWPANGTEDLENIKRAIAADREGTHTFTAVDAADWQDAYDWLTDAINDAEDWATEHLAGQDLYFGSHPDIGDWGCWPIDEELYYAEKDR